MATAGGQTRVPASNPLPHARAGPRGDLSLRADAGRGEAPGAWKKEILRKNPDIGDHAFLPSPRRAGPHGGISTLADLFAGQGDTLVLPDLLLGQLSAHFRDAAGSRRSDLSLLLAAGRLQVRRAARPPCAPRPGRRRSILLLNFPNNPTGYSPTKEEADAVVSVIGDWPPPGRGVLSSRTTRTSVFSTNRRSTAVPVCAAVRPA